jgi:hypothetical protein
MWKAVILDVLQWKMIFSNTNTVALINVHYCRRLACLEVQLLGCVLGNDAV